ncbi:cation:proton antiporter [Streptococcus parauberis]|uniref:cation:proton antiporter n=1 Tax=Streptococcus parauberis TaxID=1348 RepID=UPI000789AC8C|nr:sodium:proton antiporter [Streptococcus parauberis]KYP18125.1 Sodium, potassium, lithium and rubidium/H(+) antiporter [Streptococcus parauberis]KYP19002.1 Sodium, potassium, lithium and rubidium/H(+) antiporter [Streptococcus parauberis]KYP19781.1 Sodium, potassium, lithium and rubidium/H(+) antiporter [Streptococcus parauberis]KYP23247.1 Sodium, potassium, lithium and rubidium/H(+) antiporter [Streptococcus parauberis]KYP26738.1 Sodium, potassium, lithium and rubidium/H(+) antiporter [Stre
MSIPILVITFLLSLILSNVINRIFPQIPLPAIQLFFGILFGIFNKGHHLIIDPEIFLAFVIAPLNFREGQESDVKSFIRSRGLVLYLILPAVMISTIVMGYGIKTLLPVELPLALCFAMGAALAPTDAVAFLSLAKRFKFPNRIKNTLTSEGLLNDASALVAFQFALTALVTGYFSLADAGLNLLFSILGGIVIGLIFALLNRIFLSVLEKFDAADVTGALLLELTLPFVVYFIAHMLHVSGIIAVVVAGVMQANRIKKVTLFDAQVDRVTNIIWETINFILNGLVFIIFGVELTQFTGPLLASPSYSNVYLLFIVVILTALLFLIRYLTIIIYFFFRSRKYHKAFKKYLPTVNLLTFSGVKGSVSLAIILLIPQIDTYKNSLTLFTVGAITLLSFLIGLLVLPRLAPVARSTENYLTKIDILTSVVKKLETEGQKAQANQAGLYYVLDAYNRRIENLILEQEPNNVKEELAELQLLMLAIENEGLEHAFRHKDITIFEYRIYQTYIKSMERQVNRSFISSFNYSFTILLRVIRHVIHEMWSVGSDLKSSLTSLQKARIRLSEENRDHLTDLYLANTELILESLEDLEGFYNSSLVNFLQNQRIQNAELMKSGLFVERVIANFIPDSSGERIHGYYLERQTIHEFEVAGHITAREAQQLRDEVNELESYSLRDNSPNFVYDIINYRHQLK